MRTLTILESADDLVNARWENPDDFRFDRPPSPGGWELMEVVLRPVDPERTKIECAVTPPQLMDALIKKINSLRVYFNAKGPQ